VLARNGKARPQERGLSSLGGRAVPDIVLLLSRLGVGGSGLISPGCCRLLRAFSVLCLPTLASVWVGKQSKPGQAKPVIPESLLLEDRPCGAVVDYGPDHLSRTSACAEERPLVQKCCGWWAGARGGVGLRCWCAGMRPYPAAFQQAPAALIAPQAAAASSGDFAAVPASPHSPEALLQARGPHRLRPLNRRTDRVPLLRRDCGWVASVSAVVCHSERSEESSAWRGAHLRLGPGRRAPVACRRGIFQLLFTCGAFCTSGRGGLVEGSRRWKPRAPTCRLRRHSAALSRRLDPSTDRVPLLRRDFGLLVWVSVVV